MSHFSSIFSWLASWISKSEKNAQPFKGDEIITHFIGSFGRYQLYIYFLVVSVKIPLAFQMFAHIFVAPKTTTFVGDVGTQGECPASHPKYNTPIFRRNIITEWNLICEQKWMQGFSQTIFQFGNLFGSLFFGTMSDRYGRKWSLVVACGGEFFFGLTGAFMPTYWTYTLMRFLVGFFCAGTLIIAYVTIMEFIGPKYRPTLSPLIQVPFCLGHMLLPLIAYYLDDYKSLLICIGASAFMFILFIFMLPETPRWLLAMKKTEKCIKVLEKVAKFNKLPTSEIRTQITEYHQNLHKTEKKVTRKGNCLDLLKSPSMRKHIIICCMEWLTLGFTYYGLAQYVGSFGGNIFINVEASAILTCIGAIIGIPFIKRFGRKTTSFATFLICSASTLIMTLTYNDIAREVLACISIFCAITAWTAAYLFTSELFPTVVRTIALGCCAMSARTGSMIAPLIVDVGDTNKWLPPLLFGLPALVITILIIFLPETKGFDMMTTLEEERKRFGKMPPVTIDSGTQSIQSAPPKRPPPAPPPPPPPPPSPAPATPPHSSSHQAASAPSSSSPSNLKTNSPKGTSSK